jgi:hypothetical protein
MAGRATKPECSGQDGDPFAKVRRVAEQNRRRAGNGLRTTATDMELMAQVKRAHSEADRESFLEMFGEPRDHVNRWDISNIWHS